MKTRMLHGILVFYVIINSNTYFQNLVFSQCSQNHVFRPRMDTERGCGTIAASHEKGAARSKNFVQRLFSAPSTADAVPFPVIAGKA